MKRRITRHPRVRKISEKPLPGRPPNREAGLDADLIMCKTLYWSLR